MEEWAFTSARFFLSLFLSLASFFISFLRFGSSCYFVASCVVYGSVTKLVGKSQRAIEASEHISIHCRSYRANERKHTERKRDRKGERERQKNKIKYEIPVYSLGVCRYALWISIFGGVFACIRLCACVHVYVFACARCVYGVYLSLLQFRCMGTTRTAPPFRSSICFECSFIRSVGRSVCVYWCLSFSIIFTGLF